MHKIKYLIPILLSLMSFFASADLDCQYVEQTTVAQCETLKSIWENTDGENWSNAGTNQWMQTNNPCQWDGVSCWGSRVAGLYLGSQNLRGELPDLSGLPELRGLDVGNNQLFGAVPDLTKNSKLEKLYLFNNDFSGLLPNFNQMPKLIKIVAHNNEQLFGPLVFNGNPLAEQPVVHNTALCRSRIIYFGQWSGSVASLALCQGYEVMTELSHWNVTANDGKDDSHGLNNFLAMRNYSQGEYPIDTLLEFDAGLYEFDKPIRIFVNLILK